MTFVLRANDQARQRVIENACEFLRRLSPAKSWRVDVAEHKECIASVARPDYWCKLEPPK